MANEIAKLKGSISAAPIGAAAGAVIGYFISKKLGYDKTISVISFAVVGTIIGSAVGAQIKN